MAVQIRYATQINMIGEFTLKIFIRKFPCVRFTSVTQIISHMLVVSYKLKKEIMNKLNDENLKLAVQKGGRLTEETLGFLRKSGLEFESYGQRLFSKVMNFPLEILYVRDDDISGFVAGGIVDIGIVGQNILYEARPKVKKLLNLRFGYCSLVVAVPKESEIKNMNDLNGRMIATTFPKSTEKFLRQNQIKASIIDINGSVEISPALGIAPVISDLVSTGSTLALNDMRVLTKIYASEAVLIACPKTAEDRRKKLYLSNLLSRFQGVLSARNYKYVMFRAPLKSLSKIKKAVSGIKPKEVDYLLGKDSVSVQSIIKEDIFWESVERIKKAGVESMLIIPLEKAIF